LTVSLENSRASAIGTATIGFTTVNVENFNKVTVTLTGFTSAGTIAVVGFSGFDQGSSPIATATMASGGVLTVIFSSGRPTAGRHARFTCTSIINPSVPQSPSFNVAAATFATTTVLSTTTTGSLSGILPASGLFDFNVNLENSRASSTGKVAIAFTPANVAALNKVVVTLTGFRSAGDILVGGFRGEGFNNGYGGYFATATLIDYVLTVTFSSASAALNAGLVSFVCTNIINPSPQISGQIAAATMTATTVLDTTTTGTLPGITLSNGLLNFNVRLDNSHASTTSKATISFTPTNVEGFNKVVVTLTGFTSTGNILVGGFSGPSFNWGSNNGQGFYFATATLISGVLTVTFSSASAALNAGAPASASSFVCTNIINPNAPQAQISTIAAATMIATSVLDTTTTGSLPAITPAGGLINFNVNLDSPRASSTGKVTIAFTPTNVEGLNKVVVTLTGFTSTGDILVGSFSGQGFNYGQGFYFATATLTSGVLTVTFSSASAALNAGLVSFVCTNIINPSVAQNPSNNVAAATMSGNTVLDTTTTGTLVLISGINGLHITLASAVKSAVTTASFTFTPIQALTSVGANAGIIITLVGAGIAVDTSGSPSLCQVTAPAAVICVVSLAGSKLTVKLPTGTAYAANTMISFTVTKFTNPTAVQAAMIAIAAGTSLDVSAGTPTILDTTTTGTVSEITPAR